MAEAEVRACREDLIQKIHAVAQRLKRVYKKIRAVQAEQDV